MIVPQTLPRRVRLARPVIVRRGQVAVVNHVAALAAVARRRGRLLQATTATGQITPTADARMSRPSGAAAATGRITAAHLTAEIAAAIVSSPLTRRAAIHRHARIPRLAAATQRRLAPTLRLLRQAVVTAAEVIMVAVATMEEGATAVEAAVIEAVEVTAVGRIAAAATAAEVAAITVVVEVDRTVAVVAVAPTVAAAEAVRTNRKFRLY